MPGAKPGKPFTGNPYAGNPPAVFRLHCGMCHTSAKDGPNAIGPNLWGVAGNPASHDPDYNYSDALRGSGLVWDDATLDKWLTGPRQLVPHAKMTYSGQSDPAKRAEIIIYLKTLQ